MTRYGIEVKHDTKHRKWHRLSVSMKEPWHSEASMHAEQYAIDNQMNKHQIACRLVNMDTGDIYATMLSNATINRDN
jgi:hypothetical protein